MKIGDYVRTKHYGISKITDIYNEDKIELDNVNAFGIKGVCYMTENIIKSSPKIIDLIEVGDYVNGRLVHDNLIYLTEFGWVDFDTLEQTDTRQIKSVVTHEQFEKMMYKIGDK